MADKVPTVFVVDDVDVNVEILEEILKDEYVVMTAFNGKEALEKLGDASSSQAHSS